MKTFAGGITQVANRCDHSVASLPCLLKNPFARKEYDVLEPEWKSLSFAHFSSLAPTSLILGSSLHQTLSQAWEQPLDPILDSMTTSPFHPVLQNVP